MPIARFLESGQERIHNGPVNGVGGMSAEQAYRGTPTADCAPALRASTRRPKAKLARNARRFASAAPFKGLSTQAASVLRPSAMLLLLHL